MFHTSARTMAGSVVVAALLAAGGSLLPQLTSRSPQAQASVTPTASTRRHPVVPPDAARPTPVRPRFTGTLRVSYFGDSLAHEAQDHFDARLRVTGHADVHLATYGGTAICDWFERMRTEAATWRPNVAVIEFSGNALTPCMQGATGAPLEGAAYVAKYRTDAQEVVRIFTAVGAHVYFAGAPESRRQADDPDYRGGAINAVYRTVARAGSSDVRFVDAGASVLDHGRWTETLPCTAHEPCGASGRNIVRAPDGAHFCPTGDAARRGVTGACAVWSSGAYRYALAMARPVVRDYAL
jgi:hypothetical protein